MANKKSAKKKGNRNTEILIGLILVEAIIFIFLLFSAVLPYTDFVLAAVGEDNVSVTTLLQIGNTFPEILTVSINNDATGVDLTPNSTTTVTVNITARDFNGEGDIANITAEFFDMDSSSYGAADDNNNHYSNSSCVINYTYGDQYEVSALCNFDTWYYANNATWNSTVLITDNSSLTDQGDDIISINTLLALLLPDTLDYGEVNATEVSAENQTDVTNVGNVMLNLSLSGYAVSAGDGLAMNCTLGATQNISIEYEKYNLTTSNLGAMDLSSFEGNYTNLSSSSVINEFNLGQRFNDTDQYVDDTNSTYWRIYVPLGVAGSCSGNIVFGAVQSSAT